MKTRSCSWFAPRLAAALLIAAILPASAARASMASSIEDYFTDWFARATRIQSEQPHWVTPLVTVTPRLEQEFRYDQFWQANPHGIATDNFGGGKGLELIPFQNTEIILGVPAWVAHNGHLLHSTKKKKVTGDGWADQAFLVKYRLLSANEESGNYIVTAFMGFSAPTGDDGNSSGHALFTPTLAAGKGVRQLRLPIDGGGHVSEWGRRSAGMAAGLECRFPVSDLQIFLARI